MGFCDFSLPKNKENRTKVCEIEKKCLILHPETEDPVPKAGLRLRTMTNKQNNILL